MPPKKRRKRRTPSKLLGAVQRFKKGRTRAGKYIVIEKKSSYRVYNRKTSKWKTVSKSQV